MKKLLFIILALSCVTCSKSDDTAAKTNSDCGYHNGKKLYLGPEGGCYYLSSGNNKEYVTRSECACN